MLESNVFVGDKCKEIGVTRHSSDDACAAQEHNADGLARESKFRAIAEANRLYRLQPKTFLKLNT